MALQLKRGTKASWLASTLVLASGQPGVATDTGECHYGNGVSLWAALPAASTNSPDAYLLNRGNHTGQQLSSTISDFTEAAQDAVATLLAAGTGVVLNYNDAGNTLTVTSTATGGITDPEVVRDTIGTALIGIGVISVVVNDAADTITISTTATMNSPDATLLNRANHTGQSLTSGMGSGTPAAGKYVDGAAGAWTSLPTYVSYTDAAVKTYMQTSQVFWPITEVAGVYPVRPPYTGPVFWKGTDSPPAGGSTAGGTAAAVSGLDVWLHLA